MTSPLTVKPTAKKAAQANAAAWKRERAAAKKRGQPIRDPAPLIGDDVHA